MKLTNKAFSPALMAFYASLASGQDTSCFTSTKDILDAQVAGQKEIIICPGTTINIGIPANEQFSDFVSGDYPLGAIADDVTIKCGEDGSSANGCVMSGGFIQFVTTSFNPLIPAEMNPTSTNNLLVQGITFTGTLVETPLAGNSVMGLSAPGMNQVFDDIVIDDVVAQTLLFFDSNVIAPLEPNTASVMIKNSVIKDSSYVSDGIRALDQVRMDFENVLFQNLVYVISPELGFIKDDAFIYLENTPGSVKKCTFDNIEAKTAPVFVRAASEEEIDFEYDCNEDGTLALVLDADDFDYANCLDGLILAVSPFGEADLNGPDQCVDLFENCEDVPLGGGSSATHPVGGALLYFLFMFSGLVYALVE